MITRSESLKTKMPLSGDNKQGDLSKMKPDQKDFDLKAAFISIQKSMDSLHEEVRDIRIELATLRDIKQSLEYTQNDLIDVKTNVTSLETQVKQQATQISVIHRSCGVNQSENSQVKEQMLKVDSYTRRENLKFAGVREEDNERPNRTKQIILDLFESKLGLTDATEMRFQRCHRLGVTSDHKKTPREIIVRFAYFPDREKVWAERIKLKGSEIYIKEDFCQEIDQRRAKLYPVFKAAKSNNMKAKLVVDTLIVEGQRYTIQTLDKLPPSIQPKVIAEHRTDSTVMFFGENSCFSNFYKSDLMINGQYFKSVEQYFQYQKAKCTEDDDVARKILLTEEPREQHRLGKSLKVQGSKWDTKLAKQIMETAVLAKFDQNDALKSELLDTKNKTIVECNPHDLLWSCGLKLSQVDKASDSSQWKGENALGSILCSVRDSLK
jgi:ribA/ribD-fused uncharacterized protein